MGALAAAETICNIDVLEERWRQHKQWGQQDHPDGTDQLEQWYREGVRESYKRICDQAAKEDRLTWREILLEEVYEALAETDQKRLRTELVQLAAVAVAWVEAIDRRRAK